MSTRTLQLTSWYLPIRVLRWEDAVKLVYLQSADVLAEYDEEIRSPSVVWKTPAVIRMRRAGRYRKATVKFSRRNVYVRDDFTCQYCGRQFSWEKLSLDHVVPRSRGGTTEFTNVVTSCRPCNERKANYTCDEIGMFPLAEPCVPKALVAIAPVLDGKRIPDEWRPFLPDLSAMSQRA